MGIGTYTRSGPALCAYARSVWRRADAWTDTGRWTLLCTYPLRISTDTGSGRLLSTDTCSRLVASWR